MTGPARTEIERLAYHEAGHAVAAHVLGFRVEEVSITRRLCQHATDQLLEEDTALGGPTEELRKAIEGDMVYYYAGLAAEVILMGHDPRPADEQGRSADEAHVAEQAEQAADFDADQAGKYVGQAWERATALLKANWKAVESLAAELLLSHDLPGERATRIVVQNIVGNG